MHVWPATMKPRIRGKTDALLMRKTRTLFFSFRTRLVHIEHKYVDFHILQKNYIYIYMYTYIYIYIYIYIYAYAYMYVCISKCRKKWL